MKNSMLAFVVLLAGIGCSSGHIASDNFSRTSSRRSPASVADLSQRLNEVFGMTSIPSSARAEGKNNCEVQFQAREEGGFDMEIRPTDSSLPNPRISVVMGSRSSVESFSSEVEHARGRLEASWLLESGKPFGYTLSIFTEADGSHAVRLVIVGRETTDHGINDYTCRYVSGLRLKN